MRLALRAATPADRLGRRTALGAAWVDRPARVVVSVVVWVVVGSGWVGDGGAVGSAGGPAPAW
jgi:hypothetical protein